MLRSALAALLVLATPAIADEHREHGPHLHGTGALEIAFDGNRIEIDLEVPAADLLGFEHVPASDAEAAALQAAMDRLADPLALFTFPAAAGCTVTGQEVDADLADGADDSHGEFEAEYDLTCTTPEKIDSIDFGYFDAFPNAQRLEIAGASAKGAFKAEVTRAAQRLSLQGRI